MLSPRAASQIFTFVLSLWLGVVLTIGGVAAYAFPAMHRMHAMLESPVPGAVEPWRAVAGSLMTPLFLLIGWGGVCLLPTIGVFGWGGSRPAPGQPRAAWLACGAFLGAAIAAAAAFMLIGREMGQVWEGVRNLPGTDTATAPGLMATMERLHPYSSSALGVEAAAMLLAIIANIRNARYLGMVK